MTEYGIFYNKTKPAGNRLFTGWREIFKGPKKGRIEVFMKHYDQPKKVIVEKTQIKRFPDL